MRYILYITFTLFTLTACQDKEQTQKEQLVHDAQIAKQVRLELQKEFAQKEAKLQQALAEKEAQLLEQQTHNQATKETLPSHTDKLNDMGIHLEEGVISIDTNKTKDFFKTLSNTMNAKIKEVHNDMEKGIIDIKNAGIEINNEHINIDLNKTKELLNTWSQKMQIFVQEFDSLSQKLDNNTTIKGN